MKPHRSFRFSLRTFVVLVALAGCGMGWVAAQVKWIRDRHEALRHYAQTGVILGECYMSPVDADPPWSIRIFGEQGWIAIYPKPDAREWDRQRIEALFPEARFVGTLDEPSAKLP